MARTEIRLVRNPPRLADADLSLRLARDEYQKRKDRLQLRMLQLQQAYFHQQRRGIVVLEGFDAAGKGSAIQRMTETLDPRGYKVWPIGAPGAAEQGKHYLYRFWERLPAPGSLAIFDRSWYGRVLVERVEGLVDKPVWKRAYDEINEFERLLVDDGVRIVKLFFTISKDEQGKRFAKRVQDPLKRWKLTAEDLRNRARWDDYEKAADDMLARTSTVAVPWTVIPANDKRFARVEALKVVAKALGDGIDLSTPLLDPKVRTMALELLGIPIPA
jgi:polyphosphate kinase 2 (PPK2 family)